MTDTQPRPIVDPTGDWLYVPAEIAPTQEAAQVYAQSYWPDRPCYDPFPAEHLKVVSYEDADEDGRATLDEYGGDGVAEPCEIGEGQMYWPIRCYPDIRPEDPA